jgi:hypothetical protein
MTAPTGRARVILNFGGADMVVVEGILGVSSRGETRNEESEKRLKLKKSSLACRGSAISHWLRIRVWQSKTLAAQ